jgi:uncharacterized protein YndB with AHSA1/START domain
VAAVLDDKILRIVRVFDAPRERVFDAWVVQENFIQWMCPPNVHVDEVKLDARPGGAWHLRGHETTVRLEFRALGDKTEMTLIHGPFADTPSCNAHFEGWTGSFGKLETYLRRTA